MMVKRIALAIAFSPRLEANLAEAARLRALFNARLFLIHVGEHSYADDEVLKKLFQKYALDASNTEILWKDGSTVDTILDCCREEHIDLLVTGAMEKEGVITYLKGSVARQLGRKAQCSVLMLTEPSVNPHPFKNIVVSSMDQSNKANIIEMAIYVARLDQASNVSIVQESDLLKIANLSQEDKTLEDLDQVREHFVNEDTQKLNEILSCTDCGNLHITTHHLEGKPGVGISNYAREQQADLLVLGQSEKKLGIIDRVFQHDIEYVLANLPCNLLIVQDNHLN